MELDSIIVRFAFLIIQVICLSSLPLGRLFLQVFMATKVLTAGLVVFNFVLMNLLAHRWGLGAQVVVEVLGTYLGLLLLARGNPHVEKGLRIILSKPKVEVQD